MTFSNSVFFLTNYTQTQSRRNTRDLVVLGIYGRFSFWPIEFLAVRRYACASLFILGADKQQSVVI